MRRYTVYGGSFDPVHCGHMSLVKRAVALGYEVIMVPAFRHAFGKQSAPFEHRARMCELALQACQLVEHARVYIIERSLAPASGAPVYTYDVLCHLRAQLGSAAGERVRRLFTLERMVAGFESRISSVLAGGPSRA